ncbi:caa(3)-type oxidase [Pelobium manganitolerans]|uniref:Caa(3)-type oxidase n=1 Tax=Pelobium manganitolerans TaxID=1842495 RepID=A0A419S1S8_9SPHI|nr:cytochrome C oxidase subunit IV family protein [Pelobium manganitolerans]RKD12444.1 caa(3)-type oxidase [Pelobium manganitolerans]
MSFDNTDLAHEQEHATMSKGKIWKVFFILLGITVVEFIIALGVPHTVMSDTIRNSIYVILTLFKAYYIIAYFMHLKFEKYAFIAGLVLSLVFIIYFIILLLIEGHYLHGHMFV